VSQSPPSLFKHRPFQIAWVWEIVCVLAGVGLFLMTENIAALIGLIVLGAAPMMVVVLLYVRARGAEPGPKPDRSGDIVQ